MNDLALTSTGAIRVFGALVVIALLVAWSYVWRHRNMNALFAGGEGLLLASAEKRLLAQLYTGLLAFEKAYLASNQQTMNMNVSRIFEKYHDAGLAEKFGAYRAVSYEYHGLIALARRHFDEATEWFEEAVVAAGEGGLRTETAIKHMRAAKRIAKNGTR